MRIRTKIKKSHNNFCDDSRGFPFFQTMGAQWPVRAHSVKVWPLAVARAHLFQVMALRDGRGSPSNFTGCSGPYYPPLWPAGRICMRSYPGSTGAAEGHAMLGRAGGPWRRLVYLDDTVSVLDRTEVYTREISS